MSRLLEEDEPATVEDADEGEAVELDIESLEGGGKGFIRPASDDD